MSEPYNYNQPPPSDQPPPTFVNCDVDKSKQVQMPLMIAPGNHERAWNDPPMLAATKPSGVTKLNKRVAFPLSSPGTNPNQMSPPIMMAQPPNLPAVVPGLPQQGPYVLPPNQFVPSTNVSFTPYAGYNNIETQESLNRNEIMRAQGQVQDSKEQVMNSLRRSVDDSALEASQKDEVHKRLDMLAANWNTVEDNLKMQLAQLTNSIDSRDYREADRIQMLIGQDYMSQHSSWILALRNVIRVLLTMQQPQQEQVVQS